LFLFCQLTGLTDSDKEALVFVVKAAAVIDEIFYLQVLIYDTDMVVCAMIIVHIPCAC